MHRVFYHEKKNEMNSTSVFHRERSR